MRVVLLSTYDMGRQPFGLASPAAWLKRAGAEVECVDLSRDKLPAQSVRAADLIAFHLPMHTATRMAARAVERVRRLNPRAHLCFYGLYAPVNESYLRSLGAQTILGGEFEPGLVALLSQLDPGKTISLDRLQFITPDRTGLPTPARYAQLHVNGEHRLTGYTEASRGCKHLCRHCPVVPVYKGTFRIVQREVVIADIAQQVAAGAQHIVFGDPDFFNGPAHGLAIVEELHRQFPDVTYDVTIKIEHLLAQARHLATLRDTGCLFVTTAVESIDDAVLTMLDKGHTRADFLRTIGMFRDLGLALNPTFIPFHPWTTLDGYRDLLQVLIDEGMVNHVSPIQLGIRLLVPAGSLLLGRMNVGPFDQAALSYPWTHADPRVDALAARVQAIVADSLATPSGGSPGNAAASVAHPSRAEVFRAICDAAGLPGLPPSFARTEVPYLNEPWYC